MTITVELKNRSYQIYINKKSSLPEQLLKTFPRNNFVLVTNKTLERLYEQKLSAWEKYLCFKRWILDDGEHYKTLDTWKHILDFLLESKCDRDTVVLAFGGGVIGDITGFAASTFLRGVTYIQIPTTLLAMVDSSIGGKTGVNHPIGKNLIGSFYQPTMVWIDTKMLQTLPQREFDGGYAEIFKYAFIGGKDMFNFILTNHENIIAQEQGILEETIKKCIKIKAKIVSEDEKESGNRKLLNFGHTFGHALERFYNFKGIIHGEGVRWGIACAIELGKITGTIPKESICLYDKMLSKLSFPTLKPKPDMHTVYPLMFSDKKVRNGKVQFIVPTEPGNAIIANSISEKDLFRVFKNVFQ